MNTPRLLTTLEDPIEPNVFRVHTAGNWLLRIQHNGEQRVEQQRDNIQRLAACWNKFDGIPTEGIEAMPGGIIGLANAHANALLQIGALKALMARIETVAHDDAAWAAFRKDVLDATVPATPKH